MNRDFLELYDDELYHIREVAQEFARLNPRAAGRLELDPRRIGECADPFVERLLEGFAFMTARVRLKLDAEYPRFTQGILETVYPDYLAPWPSAAIVHFAPTVGNDDALLKGRKIPRDSLLESRRVGGTRCTFRTAHEVTLLPLRVKKAEYISGDARHLVRDFRQPPVSVIRIRLEMQGLPAHAIEHLSCERLAFYLDSQRGPRLASDVLEALFAGTTEILVAAPGDAAGAARTSLDPEHLRHAGFEENEAMLPGNPRGFEGHRILREHFLLPQRNHFFEVSGLGPAFKTIPGREVDLFFGLRQAGPPLPQSLPEDFLQLFCTPVINLFKTSANRVPIVRCLAEYPVIIERTHARDHEIYRIEKVTGFGRESAQGRTFYPFYLQPAAHTGPAGHYTVRRAQRDLPMPGETEGRSEDGRTIASSEKYRGSEMYVSIVNTDTPPAIPPPPISGAVEELQMEAWCTNRHLPIDLAEGLGTDDDPRFRQSDFLLRADLAHIGSIRLLTKPTAPSPAFTEGRDAWRAVSHLSLNYLSLVESASKDRTDGADALRALLQLYIPTSRRLETSALVEGIRQVTSEPALRRSPLGGPVAFIRGINIDLTLEDSAYRDSGTFALASVLEQFFARYVSINHFTCLTLHTRERKEIMQWPARVGRMPVC